MKKIITSKNIVNRKNFTDFKIQTFLLAFSVVTHVAATSVKTEHPLFGWFLTLLETVGWINILAIWAIVLMKGIQHNGPKLWKKIWTYTQMHVRVKKAKKNDLTISEEPFVSPEQLNRLWKNVNLLGLALHDMTPELEQARRTHFQMLGEDVPALVLPAQNSVLYAEFKGLVRFLNRFGFSKLESVRLQQRDFEFAQTWGRELQARLQQAQKDHNYQLHAMQWLLDAASDAFKHIGSQYQQAQNDPGYQRIHGALKLLMKMAQSGHSPEEVTSYLTTLMQDMDSLRMQLKQAAA